MVSLTVLFSAIFVVMATLSDTTGGDPTQPENMTCVLYAGRLLTCNYDLRDGIDSSNTTCTTCSQFSTHDTCPDVVTGKRCNTAVGRCEYNCDDLTFCDNFHKMKITVKGGKDAGSESMCRQIKTTDYLQPGPVRALRVTAISSTALRVSWKKPDDRLRSLRRRYTYSVTYLTKHVKKVKTKDEDVEVVLSDLQPWTNYTVTVRSRPHRKGFRGPPQKATNATLEDVPASGPVIPESAYSRVAPGVLEVYWSSVPRDASRGVIVNYSVQASCCLSHPLYTTDHSTTVNITGHSNLTVHVNAATRNGWSANPSQLIYRRDLVPDLQDIDRVDRAEDLLEWVYRKDGGKQPDFFTVFRCFGSQNDTLPQLVKCRSEVNTTRVPGDDRALPLEDHEPPTLACTGCEWQYAVSVHVDNVSSPMMWNTPLQNFANRPSVSSTRNDWPVIVLIIAMVVAVCAAVTFLVVKKDVLCERFKITLPQMMPSISDEEEQYTKIDKDDTSGKDQGLKDTLQIVFTTNDELEANESGVTGGVLEEDGQTEPLLEDQLLPPVLWMQDELGDESSEAMFCLTDSVVPNYKQVTKASGTSQTQGGYPCTRTGVATGQKTSSSSVSHDCSDKIRQISGHLQGDHILPCGHFDSPDEDEGWSCSSDSGVSTYRQVPIDSDVSQSQEDCPPDESSTIASAEEPKNTHDRTHSIISDMTRETSFVS